MGWISLSRGGWQCNWANVSDQTPAALDSAMRQDACSRLSASDLFVPVAGVKYSVMCDGVGLGEDKGIDVTISTSGNLVKGAEVNSGLHDAP